MKIRTFLKVSALLLISSVLFAAVPGSQILTVVPDARTSALGYSYCANSEDIASIYFNPAGIGGINHIEIPYSRNYLPGNIDELHFGFAFSLRDVRASNVNDLGTISVNVLTLDSNVLNQDIWIVGYGKSLFDDQSAGNLLAGFSLKQYKDETLNVKTESQVFDAGVIWKYPGKNISAGLSVQNVNNAAKFIRGESELPSFTRFGISGGMFNNTLIIKIDHVNAINDRTGISTGVEYRLFRTLSLRSGYNSRVDSSSAVSVGMGIALKNLDYFFIYARELDLDYAYIPNNLTGDTHKISLLVKLGAD